MNLYKDKHGAINWRAIKLLLAGPPQVGKTSTKLRLLDEDLTRAPCSTGLERPVEVCLDTIELIDRGSGATVIGLDSTIWKRFSRRELAQILLQRISQGHNTHVQQHIHVTETAGTFTPQTLRATPTTHTTHIARTEHTKVSHETSDEFVRELIMGTGWNEVVSSVAAHLDCSTTAYIIDTGGQPEFHAVLPLLLRGPALYLLFFNLNESLDKCYNIRYTTQDGTTLSGTSTYTSSYSTLHTLSQLLNSFACDRSTPEDTVPIAIVLATHLDLVSRETLTEADRKLREVFSPKDLEKTSRLIHDAREGGFDSIFVPVNNKDGTKIQEVREFLRKAIKIARRKPVRVATLWLLFHYILRSNYEDQQVCSFDECADLAVKCGIEREHVGQVLNYIHLNLGTILYYDDIPTLSQLVIVNPEVLFKCISKLICRVYEKTGDTTHNHGEIPSSIFRDNLHTTIQESRVGSLLTIQYVINLMTHFNIVMSMKPRESQLNLLCRHGDGSYYFMPCLLRPDINITPCPSPQDIEQHPLVVCFTGRSRVVPVGLVPALAIELGSLPQWSFPPRRRYSNHFEFMIRADDQTVFILELLLRHSQLELRVKFHDGSLVPGKVRYLVFIKVRDAIKKVMALLGYDQSRALYLLYCPEGHVAEYRESYVWCVQPDCPHAYDYMAKPQPPQRQWFTEVCIYYMVYIAQCIM